MSSGKIASLIFAVVFAFIFSPGVFAGDFTNKLEENKTLVDTEMRLDFFSKYMWRGQPLNDEPVFQPSMTFSKALGDGNLSFNVWGNLDFTDSRGDSGEFTEADYTLDWSSGFPGIKWLGYSLGFIRYDLLRAEDTTEVYSGINFKTVLSPSIKWYYDVDEVQGSYFQFSISQGYEKIVTIYGVPFGLNTSASLGYANKSFNRCYCGVNNENFNDLTLGISFPAEIHGWAITPSLGYSTILSSEIRESDSYEHYDNFFGGISFAKKF
jgi:hypothetical protein